MNNSILWLRAIREIQGLTALSDVAEKVYFDALQPIPEEDLLRGMRLWCRNFEGVPTPHQLRDVMSKQSPKHAGDDLPN